MDKIRILLADDHTVLREGLRAAFEMDEKLKVVGEAVDGEEVIRFVKNNDIDLIVMDISMPKLDGISASKIIKKENPRIKILLLTMYDNKQYVMDALSAGIDGYILKMADMQKVFNAIHLIHKGDTYFDFEITSNLKEGGSNHPGPSDVTDRLKNNYGLTTREIEILQLTAKGLTALEIAERLFISYYTVNNHKRNIITKLQLKNVAEMVRFAIKEGLID